MSTYRHIDIIIVKMTAAIEAYTKKLKQIEL
jgi:hypothetical protein